MTKSPNQRKKSVFTEPVVAIVLSILLTIVLRLSLEEVQPHLSGLLHLWWFRIVATVAFSMSGCALFLLKKRFQTFYGFSEIGFALVVIWTGIGRVQTTGDATSWIALIGGAYLIVRGLTNYDEGTKKRLKTP